MVKAIVLVSGCFLTSL